MPGAAAQVCRGNLGARSLARGRLHFAPAQADQHQRLADLSRRFRRMYKTSPMPVRRPPRATERRYLCKIRRLRVFRPASIRRREKAGLQLPLFYDRCELPDFARADRGSRPEYDAPVRSRQWIRTLRSGYPRQGAIYRRRCEARPSRRYAKVGTAFAAPAIRSSKKSACFKTAGLCPSKETARIFDAIWLRNSRTSGSRYVSTTSMWHAESAPSSLHGSI